MQVKEFLESYEMPYQKNSVRDFLLFLAVFIK